MKDSPSSDGVMAPVEGGAAGREHLEHLESEMQRVVKRPAAANRAASAASERTEAPAS